VTTSPFPIRTARDLLDKGKREIEGLVAESEGISGTPKPATVADLAYNAACSLWHVTDWIVNSPDPKLQAIVVSKGCRTPDSIERG